MTKKSAYVKQQEAIALAAQQKIDEANAPSKQLGFDLSSLKVVVSEYAEKAPDSNYRGLNYEVNRSNFLAYIGIRYNLASLAHLDDEARGLEILKTSALFFRVEMPIDSRDKKTGKRTGQKEPIQSSIYCIGENAPLDIVQKVEAKHARELAENKKPRLVYGSQDIISKFAQAIDEKKAFYLVVNGRNQGTVKEEINNTYGFFVERDDRRQSIEAQMLEPLELGFSCNEQIYSGGKSVHHYITFKNCPDEGIPAEQAAELQQIILRLGGYDGFINKDGGNLGDLKVKTSRMYGSYNQKKLIAGIESQVRSLAKFPLLTFEEHWQLVSGKALGEYIPQENQPREIKEDGTEGNILWAYADVCDHANWLTKFKPYVSLEDRKAAQLKREQEKEAKKATQPNLADLSQVIVDINQSSKAVDILKFLYPKNRNEILSGTPDGTGRSYKRAFAIALNLFEIETVIKKFGLPCLQTAEQLFESWLSKTFQASEVQQIASAKIAYSNASKSAKPPEEQVNAVRLSLVAQQSLSEKKPKLFLPSKEAAEKNPHYGSGFLLPDVKNFTAIRNSPYAAFICQTDDDALALSNAGFIAVSYTSLSLVNGELPVELQDLISFKKDVYLVPETLNKTDWKANDKLMNSWEVLGQKLTQELGKDQERQELLKVINLPYNFKSIADILNLKKGEGLLSQMVYEAVSFKRWQYKHQRAFYAPVDLSINAGRLTDAVKTTDIPNDAKKIIVKSTQGTGKTVFLTEMIKDYQNSTSEFFVKGSFTIVLSHRIQLCADQAKKFNIARIEDEDQVILDKKGVIACFDSILKVESFLRRNNINRYQIIIDEFCQVDDHFLSSTTEIKNKRTLAANAFQAMLNQCDRLIASDADIKTSDYHYINDLLPGNTFVIENTFKFNNRKVTVYKGKTQGLMLADIYQKCDAIVGGQAQGLKTKSIYICSQGQQVKSTWGTHNIEADLKNRYPSLKILVLSGDTLTETNHPASKILKTDINAGLRGYDIVIASPSIDTGVSIEEGHNFGWVYAFAQGTLSPTVSIQQFWRVRGDDVVRSIWVSSLNNQRKHGGEVTMEGILTHIDHERTASLNSLAQFNKLIKSADDAQAKEKAEKIKVRDEALQRIGKSLEEIQAPYDLDSCSVLPNGSEKLTEVYGITENWIFKKRYAATAAFYNLSMKATLDWVVEILEGQGCSIFYPEIAEDEAELNKSVKESMIELKEDQYSYHLDQISDSRDIGEEELKVLEDLEHHTKEQKKEIKKA
ncbi:plasmid replication protein, CyRepA1 family, partial [Nostoc sp. UIC 10890]